MTDHDIIVVGAGQAGLAAGHELKALGADFTILDARDAVGGSWPQYYDSLKLFSPARYSVLPGMDLPGDPWGYPGRDDITAYLHQYARFYRLPVETGIKVAKVRYNAEAYHLTIANGSTRTARGLIVATGAFGSPILPNLPGQQHFSGKILHSAAYKNPQPFIGQRVIVVGAGNSAVQIAAELAEHAEVKIAVRERIRFSPQRILGRDLHWWFDVLRLNGTNLFSDHGVPVIDDGRYRCALRHHNPLVRPMFKRFTDGGVEWADGVTESVDTVIFATGFRASLDLLRGSGALDDHDTPLHKRGVSTALPQLGYVGLSGQNGFASATLRGVARDASIVLSELAL